MESIILKSTLTCPECKHSKEEIMPINACQWYYECEKCRTLLRPKHGGCSLDSYYRQLEESAMLPASDKNVSGKAGVIHPKLGRVIDVFQQTPVDFKKSLTW